MEGMTTQDNRPELLVLRALQPGDFLVAVPDPALLAVEVPDVLAAVRNLGVL